MNRFWVIGNSKKVLFPGKSVFIFLLAELPVPWTVQVWTKLHDNISGGGGVVGIS